jgi:hypothetical protein
LRCAPPGLRTGSFPNGEERGEAARLAPGAGGSAREHPAGRRVQLTGAMAEFVHYLIVRDIGGKVDNYTEDKMKEIRRKDALIYKLRRLLGDDFPISFNKTTGYFIVADKK